MEAMALGLPVIATNWSGNTAFMNATNSYLISVDRMVPLPQDSSFQGHQWALASVAGLRAIMRGVVSDPSGARDVGQRARKDMVAHYGAVVVAGLIVNRVKEVVRRGREEL